MPCTGAARKGGTFVNIGRPEKNNYQVYILKLLGRHREGGEGRVGGGGTQHSLILGGPAPMSNTICNFKQKRCLFQIRSLQLCMKGE